MNKLSLEESLMAILIKSKEEREKIRDAGRIVAAILAELRDAVRPGITTAELDRLSVEALKHYGAKSSTLGYRGYPASLCTSVNEEVVHGIPGNRVLKEGDIISIDFAASYKGWHADSAITVSVGTVEPDVERLLKVTEEALYKGIAAARSGKRLQDIGRAVQQHVEGAGFSVVRYEATGLPLEIFTRSHNWPQRLVAATDRFAVRAMPTLFGYQFVLQCESQPPAKVQERLLTADPVVAHS